jgi:hypothetical protein
MKYLMHEPVRLAPTGVLSMSGWCFRQVVVDENSYVLPRPCSDINIAAPAGCRQRQQGIVMLYWWIGLTLL